MAKRENNIVSAAKILSQPVKKTDKFANEVNLHAITEIDFITYGIEPRSEVFIRASNFLNSEKAKLILQHRKTSSLDFVFDLIRWYVKQQELLFNPNRIFDDDWEKKVSMQSLMGGAVCRYLQSAIKVKDQLAKFASKSETCLITLEIIHEYEIYCSHEAEIKKYVESHRKLFRSSQSRRFYRYVLEYRDGSLCKGCGLVEKLENLHIDHIMALTLGGNSEIENLQLLCQSCNDSKGNRPMEYLTKRSNGERNINYF